jgi:hypothetical protein
MVISASTRTKKTDLMVPFVAPECGRISQMTRQKTEVSLLVRFPNACMTSISAPLQVSRCAARRLINTPISGSLDVFPAQSIGRFACRCGIRFDAVLAHLSRRRSCRDDSERVGNPHDTDPWEWNCGFYPGSHPGEHQSGTSATFAEARADFGSGWQVFLSNRTETDFQACVIKEIGPRENMRCGMQASGFLLKNLVR